MSDYPDFVEEFMGVNVTCYPLCRQPYQNCYIEAGSTDHPIDTIFLRFSRENEEPWMFFLRPDEAAAVAWVLNGALWSRLVKEVPNDNS
jgi:hypothetical protein